jgi:hypothetical protein
VKVTAEADHYGQCRAGSRADRPDGHNLDSNQVTFPRRSARMRGLPVGAALPYTRTLRPAFYA